MVTITKYSLKHKPVFLSINRSFDAVLATRESNSKLVICYEEVQA
jgi:hypothetical protein